MNGNSSERGSPCPLPPHSEFAGFTAHGHDPRGMRGTSRAWSPGRVRRRPQAARAHRPFLHCEPDHAMSRRPAVTPRTKPGAVPSASGIARSEPVARVVRGALLSYRDDPHTVGATSAVRFYRRGAVVFGNAGRTLWRGHAARLPAAHRELPCDDYGEALLVAGFIDAHVHFPQHRMLAAPARGEEGGQQQDRSA